MFDLSALHGVFTPLLFQLIVFQMRVLAREPRETVHSGCGMPLKGCQPPPRSFLAGPLLAVIPDVRGEDTPRPSLHRLPSVRHEEGRRKEALLGLRGREQCPLFSLSPDVSSYVI